MIYLYGGWDGNKDLADMWSYHVPSAEWTCISKNTDEDVRSFKNTEFSSCIVLFIVFFLNYIFFIIIIYSQALLTPLSRFSTLVARQKSLP